MPRNFVSSSQFQRKAKMLGLLSIYKFSLGCGVSANEYSWVHGAQINFGNLTPYLTYGYITFPATRFAYTSGSFRIIADRVHRIPYTECPAFSSRPNWLPPPPHPQASVAPHLVPGGGGGQFWRRDRHSGTSSIVPYNPSTIELLDPTPGLKVFLPAQSEMFPDPDPTFGQYSLGIFIPLIAINCLKGNLLQPN